MQKLWIETVRMIGGLILANLHRTMFAFGLFVASGPISFAGDLERPSILQLLKGNSISSPLFGCSYFEDEKNGVTYTINGTVMKFQWSVRGDLYLSTGRCGEVGCTVESSSMGVRFSQKSSGYDINVLLLPGNQCDREQRLT